MTVSAWLIAASALVVFTLGTVHLWLTFAGPSFHPRNAGTREAMQGDHMVFTRRTSLWNVWIGFNASHSYGAMLFGLVYGYLALAAPGFLLHDAFLLALGLVALLAYLLVGVRYWFNRPVTGIVVATLLYAAALALNLAGN